MKSSFYVVEGIDGCGKSTASKYTADYLNGIGIPTVVVEAYPRDPEAMFMRDLWIQKKVPDVAVLALIMHLRKRVMIEQIVPALLAGKVVISDRWHDTTWAYQGYGMGINSSIIDAVMKDFRLHIPTYPEVSMEQHNWLLRQITCYNTVYLDIDYDTSKKRVGVRAMLDEFEKSGATFFNKVLNGFDARMMSLRMHGRQVDRIDARRGLNDLHDDLRMVFQQAEAPVPPK